MDSHILNFKVTDKETFVAFIELLRMDFLNNPNGWENKTIDDFLEAFARYTSDIQGYYDNTDQNVNADTPDWKVFADIFKGASNYE
jgi:hypothetical protein